MCGIAGFHVRGDRYLAPDVASSLAFELLCAIDHRGGDATGYAAFTATGEARLQKASCRAWEFEKHAKPLPRNTRTCILHTRFATQGLASFPDNNHPVRSGGTYVVHNGHVWNDAELFRDSGYERIGEVDSEAIACALDWCGWDDAKSALEMVRGAMAIASVNVERPGELILGRGHDSPLYVYEGRSLIVWASTPTAVSYAWRKAIGTPPDFAKIKLLPEGTLLRVANSEVKRERFEVSQPATVPMRTYESLDAYFAEKYGWDSDSDYRNKWGWSREEIAAGEKAGISIGNTGQEVGERLGEVLDYVAERKKSGTASLFSDDLDEDPEIQCAACGEWAPLSELSGFDELLCLGCSRISPEGMVIR